MLSYKDYRRLKESNNNNEKLVVEDIDDVFNSWTSEVTSLILSPQHAERLIDFCENAVTSTSKWKTIQEHRMIKQLPLVIRQALEEECAQARLLINEAKYQVKQIVENAGAEAMPASPEPASSSKYVNPWASFQTVNQQAADAVKGEVDVVFNNLLDDLIKTFGQNRTAGPLPSASAGGQKPGVFGRAKNWLKSVWQGATGGDQNLRRYALQRGYANDPKYKQDPHAWKDAQKHPDLFAQESKLQELEDLLKESFDDATRTINGLFGKHKTELLNIIAKHALKTFSDVRGEPQRSVPAVPVPNANDDVEEKDAEDIENDEEELKDNTPIDDVEPTVVDNPSNIIKSKNVRPLSLVNSIGNQSDDGTMVIKDKHDGEHIVKYDRYDKKSRTHILTGKNDEEENVEVHITNAKWKAALAAEEESRLHIGEPEPSVVPEPKDKPKLDDEEEHVDDEEEHVDDEDDQDDQDDEEENDHADDEDHDIDRGDGEGNYDDFEDDSDVDQDTQDFDAEVDPYKSDDGGDDADAWLAARARGDDETTPEPDDTTTTPEPDDTTTTPEPDDTTTTPEPDDTTTTPEPDDTTTTSEPEKASGPHDHPELSDEEAKKIVKSRNSRAINPKEWKEGKDRIKVEDDGTISWKHRKKDWKKTQVVLDDDGHTVHLMYKKGKEDYALKNMTKEQYAKLTGEEVESANADADVKIPELEDLPDETPNDITSDQINQKWGEFDELLGDLD